MVIIKTKSGFQVESHTGKNMGKYKSKKAAKNRIRQIEFFKHQKGG